MNSWHVTYLGLKRLPRDLTAFEVEAFFTFSVAERRVIEARRGPELKLGLALQIGFLRMSGRLLDALRIVPAMLWRHLGEQFAAAAPDLASLRAMYRRRRTLFEHQGLACETLGFHWLSEPRRRALVRVLRDELARTTDHLLFMVRRRVAELWRLAGLGVEAALTDWVRMYQDLLVELGTLATDRDLSSDALREQLVALVEAHRRRKPRSRAEIVRDRLIEGVRPVHALLKALVRLPWRSTAAHPVLEAMSVLRDLYERDLRTLPATFAVPLGSVWRTVLAGKDRERAFATCEVATLLNLRRALRNGTVWIEHSLAFRSREKLFIPQERWRKARRAHYRRLSLPTDVGAFLEPLLERAAAGVRAVADAAAAGVLQVDDELHLTPLAAEEEPKLAKLRART
jgi:hypothetical protein